MKAGAGSPVCRLNLSLRQAPYGYARTGLVARRVRVETFADGLLWGGEAAGLGVALV